MNYATIERLLKEFYDYGYNTGGVLHIVLDDENIEDRHIKFCRDEFCKLDLALNEVVCISAIFNILEDATEDQRIKIARMYKKIAGYPNYDR